MRELLPQVLSGLAAGGIYASLALAMVMIYQATHHINFAQGEMATLSTYVAYTLVTVGVPYWGAFAATIAISFLLGVCVERVLMRPLGDAQPLASLGVFIALLFLFTALPSWTFTFSL